MTHNKREYSQADRERAETSICLEGKESGIAFFARHPHLGWAIAVENELELNALRAEMDRTIKLMELIDETAMFGPCDTLNQVTEWLSRNAPPAEKEESR